MTAIIIGIAALTVVNFCFKAAGPVLLADREPAPPVQELITAMTPALLAGLITVELAGGRWAGLDWTALPGLGAAAVAYRRGVPELACLAIAVLVTVLVRLAA